ncbi:MAG: hypothetical protein AAFN77_07565 [Planctomycetota bacterium]
MIQKTPQKYAPLLMMTFVVIGGGVLQFWNPPVQNCPSCNVHRMLKVQSDQPAESQSNVTVSQSVNR